MKIKTVLSCLFILAFIFFIYTGTATYLLEKLADFIFG